ncbi:MAG: AraC family transcriptional regulator [Alteromonas sp.]|nr:AraC family transcriptional regulator [Alteromonas sp.]
MELKKSIAQGIYEEVVVDEGIFVLKFLNDTTENQIFKREISTQFIQFHFCGKGLVQFEFNQGNYQLPLQEDHSLLLYNPKMDLPLSLSLPPKSWVISILLPIKNLHQLFSKEANYIPFLSEENKSHKYYKDELISPSMSIVLSQLLQFNLHPVVKPLYFKAKVYELLSLYFNVPQDMDVEQCPYLNDEENIQKIKKAKDIIIERMAEPPTLQELAQEINLPINKLKEGFKQVYGDPVFSFLFDYKMEVARQLLAGGSLNVNEVGLRVGYSTASHFIAAFKKKYGVTPKKFVMSLSS